MKSTLTIKDLSLDKQLDRTAMCAVRGGVANQGNVTEQAIKQAVFAPVAVGNGSEFGGTSQIQVDSMPTLTATNHSTSSNSQGFDWGKMFPALY